MFTLVREADGVAAIEVDSLEVGERPASSAAGSALLCLAGCLVHFGKKRVSHGIAIDASGLQCEGGDPIGDQEESKEGVPPVCDGMSHAHAG